MKQTVAFLNGLFVASMYAVAQPSPAPEPPSPQFDAASIKASRAPGREVLYHLRGGRFKVDNYTLYDLISFAYDIPKRRIAGGPPWTRSDRFDIQAVAPGETGADLENSTKKLMVKSLLAARFQLQIRQEERDSSEYALERASNTMRITPNNGQPYSILRTGAHTFLFQNVSIARFANFLGSEIGNPAVDKTGLDGTFDFSLSWYPLKAITTSRDPAAPVPTRDAGPDIFAALRDQLGLKLVSIHGMQTFIAILHVELPSAN